MSARPSRPLCMRRFGRISAVRAGWGLARAHFLSLWHPLHEHVTSATAARRKTRRGMLATRERYQAKRRPRAHAQQVATESMLSADGDLKPTALKPFACCMKRSLRLSDECAAYGQRALCGGRQDCAQGGQGKAVLYFLMMCPWANCRRTWSCSSKSGLRTASRAPPSLG